MKIIITEEQLKRIKTNLVEEVDIVGQFENYCNTKIQEVNKLYSKVIAMTIDDVISGNVNVDKISDFLNKIENDVMAADKKAYSYIENMPDSDLDLKIDAAYSRITDKTTALTLILSGLSKIQGLASEHNLTRSFNDIKPLDVTPIR